MPGTPESSSPETVLAFDFGLRRIGVAVGQQITRSASALETVGQGEDGPDWQRIDALVRDWRPARLIVGLPLTADGSPSPINDQVADFRRALARYGLPVESVDERYSSLEAEARLREQRRAGLRGRIDKAAIDAAAAVTIAERWLQQD